MKKYIAALLLASASAHAGFLSGNTLLQHINTNEHLWQAYANGYIVGVHDMGDTILFCTPPTITVGQAKDSNGNNTFRLFQGETRFSGATVFSGESTFSGVLAKMSVQPNTLGGFDDLSLITKGYFDSIYSRKNTVSGSVNGSNTTFTFANAVKTGSEAVFINGVLQSVTDDYTVSTNGSGQVTGVTFVVAPLSGSNIKAYGVY